jgi:uncharacterized protein (TIGR03435 family)
MNPPDLLASCEGTNIFVLTLRRSLLNRVRRILRVDAADDQQTPSWTIVAAVAAISIAIGVWRVDAQTPPPAGDTPKFEVAAVRPNKATDLRAGIQIQPGGRFTATNMPLRALIVHAYNLMPFQLVGPDWLDSERFDVVAKSEQDFPPAAPASGPAPQQLMLQALLAERFALQAHRDTREMSVYSMEMARADRKLGPQLKPSNAECKEVSGGVGPPTGQDKTTCGIRVMPGQLTAGGVPLSAMAFPLSMFVQRMVVDRTGLTGAFDYELRWTPDMLRQRLANAPPGQPVRLNGVEIDPHGPSIFTAVQEQLGLKLESTRGPVEVLVIDHIERPTPD